MATLATGGAVPAADAAPGDLDPGFGRGGTVETTFPEPGDAFGLVRQPDGKLVAGGNTTVGKPGNEGDTKFALARYNPDGSLDRGFGHLHDGKERIDVDGLADFGNGVALQADGKIVLAGRSGPDFVVLRLNADGTLDTGFGKGGIVRTKFPNGFLQSARAVAVLGDGKILAAGHATIIDGPQDFNTRSPNATALARYNPDGSPDAGFGAGGVVVIKSGEKSGAYAMVLQPDGRIVTAGQSSGRFAVRRFEPGGAPDPGFGSGGEFTGGAGGLFALALQGDGKIVAGGDDDDGPVAMRLGPGGSLDSGFASGGVKRVTSPIAGHHALHALGIQSDGKIVLGGFDFQRLNADGSNDTSFDAAGKGGGAALIIQPDGKIVTAGEFGIVGYGENQWLLTRVLTSGVRKTGLVAAGAHRQRVVRQRGVKLRIACPHTPCIIDTDAKVKLGSAKPRRLPRFYSSPRKARATIKVLFPKKMLAAIRRALAHRKKVTITLRVFAEFPEDPPTKPQTIVIRARR